MKNVIRYVQEENADDLSSVRELFWEYLQWANTNVDAEFAVSFDIASMLDGDMQTLEKFLPPTGRLMLATSEDRVVGIGCLKRLRPGIGEIKRMYVRPVARKGGLGRAPLGSLMTEAKVAGYSRIRLDSVRDDDRAHLAPARRGGLPGRARHRIRRVRTRQALTGDLQALMNAPSGRW